MREIKFRAWDKKQSIMSGGFSLIDCSDGYVDTEAIKLEDCELMQFTGLKDKNGKECFEGDIVRRVYDFTRAKKAKETIDQIVYRDDFGAFCFNSKTKISEGWSRMHSGHSLYWWEIIGNIYQNPELLK